MKKRDELNNPNSCLSKAHDDEVIFVILAHDPSGPGTVRDWIGRRIKDGLNRPGDAKLVEAEEVAQSMILFQEIIELAKEFNQQTAELLVEGVLSKTNAQVLLTIQPPELQELFVIAAIVTEHSLFTSVVERFNSLSGQQRAKTIALMRKARDEAKEALILNYLRDRAHNQLTRQDG